MQCVGPAGEAVTSDRYSRFTKSTKIKGYPALHFTSSYRPTRTSVCEPPSYALIRVHTERCCHHRPDREAPFGSQHPHSHAVCGRVITPDRDRTLASSPWRRPVASLPASSRAPPLWHARHDPPRRSSSRCGGRGARNEVVEVLVHGGRPSPPRRRLSVLPTSPEHHRCLAVTLSAGSKATGGPPSGWSVT